MLNTTVLSVLSKPQICKDTAKYETSFHSAYSDDAHTHTKVVKALKCLLFQISFSLTPVPCLYVPCLG